MTGWVGGGVGVVVGWWKEQKLIRGGRAPSLIHGESLEAEQRSAECFVVVLEGVPQSPIYPSPPPPPHFPPLRLPFDPSGPMGTHIAANCLSRLLSPRMRAFLAQPSRNTSDNSR